MAIAGSAQNTGSVRDGLTTGLFSCPKGFVFHSVINKCNSLH